MREVARPGHTATLPLSARGCCDGPLPEANKGMAMDTRRLLRTTSAALATAVLLTMSGCSPARTARENRKAPRPPQAATARTASTAPSPSSRCPPPCRPPSSRTTSRSSNWRDCGVAGFQCATMKAPLDYAHPDADRTSSSPSPARRPPGPGKRLGSLLVNPGGPGGSAIELPAAGTRASAIRPPCAPGTTWSAVDPRGVARSEPVECLTGKQMDTYTQTDQTPDDTAGGRRTRQRVQEVRGGLQEALGRAARPCLHRRGGPRHGHPARRAGRREAQLRGRLVRHLPGRDATRGSSRSGPAGSSSTARWTRPCRCSQLNRDQTAGFETAFKAFAEDCVKQSDCPLGTENATDAGRRLKAFFKQGSTPSPLPTGERRGSSASRWPPPA